MCLRYRNSSQGPRAYFEKGTVYFNQAGQPGLVVYKADGTEIVPELHPEYEGQTNTGINITNLGQLLIQRSNIFWNVCGMAKKSPSHRFRKA